MKDTLNTISGWLLINHYYSAVIFGLLLGVGFLSPETTFLGVLGLMGLFWLLPQLPSWGKTARASALFWGSKTLVAMSFLWSVFPIYWLTDVSAGAQLSMIGIVWLLTGFTAGMAGMIFGTSFYFITKQWRSRWVTVPLLALVWVLSEITFSLFHALSSLGVGVPVQLSFTFGYVGYLAAAIPGLYFVAILGGLYALSFVMIIIAQMIIYVARRASFWLIFLPILKFTIIVTGLFYFTQYETQSLKVAIIDTEFRHKDDTAILSTWDEQFTALHNAIKLSVSYQPDFILLPEDARYFENFLRRTDDPSIQLDLFLMNQFTGIIVDPARVDEKGGAVGRAFYWQSHKLLATQDKNYLSPYGEYRSFWLEALLRRANLTESLGGEFGDYKASNLFRRSADGQASNLPITFFCSEAMSPTVLKQRLTNNPLAPFVYHPVSHAWFNQARGMIHQLDMMLRIHSLWSRLPIVMVANEANGKLYYPDGRIIIPKVTEEGAGWRLKVIEL